MTTSCPCGCGRPVKPGNTYATCGCRWRGQSEHFSRLGKLVHQKYPEMRKERLRLARLGQQRRVAERVQGLTKQDAYTAGYRAGFQKAYRYWKYRVSKIA
jgi:hypothetical protein